MNASEARRTVRRRHRIVVACAGVSIPPNMVSAYLGGWRGVLAVAIVVALMTSVAASAWAVGVVGNKREESE